MATERSELTEGTSGVRSIQSIKGPSLEIIERAMDELPDPQRVEVMLMSDEIPDPDLQDLAQKLGFENGLYIGANTQANFVVEDGKKEDILRILRDSELLRSGGLPEGRRIPSLSRVEWVLEDGSRVILHGGFSVRFTGSRIPPALSRFLETLPEELPVRYNNSDF